MDADLYARFFEVEDWYWWSVGTRAIFRDWVTAAIRGRTGRVLDVGCGTGALVRELEPLGRVVGVDVSEDALMWSGRRGLRMLCRATADRLPFREGAFDAAVAADVIEHTDDVATLVEVARVLRAGGAVLIHVPAFPILWGEHDEVNHHLRRYRRATLGRAVEASGLRVQRISYVNCALFPATLAVRLAKRALRAVRSPRPPSPEIYDLPMWVNRALIGVLALERIVLRRWNFPVGVSLLCLARKPDVA